MTSPSEKLNPEALKQAVYQSIGQEYPILGDILCQFPELASSFIEIQQQANKSHSYKTPHFCLTMKESGMESSIAYLFPEANAILNIYREMTLLRGETELDGYYPNSYWLQNIVEIARTVPAKDERDYIPVERMTIKLLGVTDEEIQTIETYLNATKSAREQENQAADLEKQANTLRHRAQFTTQQARRTVENGWQKP